MAAIRSILVLALGILCSAAKPRSVEMERDLANARRSLRQGSSKLVTAEAAAAPAKDQAASGELGERLEALITQWNATNEKGKQVTGAPYNPKDYVQ